MICIDEFDEIVRGIGEDLMSLSGLIYQLIEKSKVPVYFFFTMTHIPPQMENEIPSTLISIAEIFPLAPFDSAETSRLVRELTAGEYQWPTSACDEIYRLSGGHPYFTKLLLSCLPQPADGRETQVTGEILQKVLAAALRNAKAEHVVKNLFSVHFSEHEKELILFMAQYNRPVSVEALEKAGKQWVARARRLQNRHYLKMDAQQAHFDFRIAFLPEWLRSWDEFDIQCDARTELRKVLSRPEIEVDDTVKIVRAGGAEIHLSSQEFKIMRCLASRADQLVERDDLVESAWDALDGVSDQTIDTAIYRLRKKLGDQGQYLETKTGQGFILRRAVLLNPAKKPS